jgi:tetratricopeptide (TPR) repeat protein
MMSKPVIFISAVSKELHSARDLVAKMLIALGYDPKWQDIAPTETGDLRGVLRQWINDSDAVLQLVGHCYGFGPKEADADLGPCSYTQYEALYARQQGKNVWYIILGPEHPTETCAVEASALRELQDAYRVKVTSTTHLYHPSSSLLQTENIVLKLRDDLAHLRKRGRQYAALVLAFLLLIVGGVAWVQRNASDTHKAVTEIKDQNDKLLQALRDLPQTRSQQHRGDAKEDEATRIARAYTVLETQLQLPPGSLAKGLRQFAQQLLQRADTSTMDRANALFAIQKFTEAEAEALKAKDHALASGQPVQYVIASLYLAGQSAEAQIHYSQALEHYHAAAALTSQERDVLQWLDLQNAISWLHYLQGRYTEGLAQTKKVWQTAQQAGQDDAPAVLTSHVLYASALHAQGKDAEAEQEYRAVLKLQQRVLGPEHPDTLRSRNNLAIALDSQGKPAEAEQEHRVLLKTEELVLGVEHPDTLASRVNLASALRAQGKPAEAERDHRVVQEAIQRVLGAEHPSSLASKNNLASALQDQGRTAEAEVEHRAVLQVQERVLGAEHPNTLVSRSNLAETLRRQGKYAEAEQEQRAVLKIMERVLGAEHPETLWSRNNLAETLRSRGKYAEAEPEQRAVLKIRERMLGAEHPDTLKSRMNLANVLKDQAKDAEVELEYRSVLKLQERVLGAEHPDTLMCRMNLATMLCVQTKYVEAEQEHRAVLKIKERVLGTEHPDTLASRNNLALALNAQGKHAEAEQEYRAVLQLEERVE